MARIRVAYASSSYHNINLIFSICLCLLYGVLICAGNKPCFLHHCKDGGELVKNKCPTDYCTCGDESDDDITERFCKDKDGSRPPPVIYEGRNRPCYESSCLAPILTCPMGRCICVDDSDNESDDITIVRFCTDKDEPRPTPIFYEDTKSGGNRPCYLSSCMLPVVNCPTDYCTCVDESNNGSDDITIERFCNNKPAQPQFPYPTDCTSKTTCSDPDNPCQDSCFCDTSISKCRYMSDYIDFHDSDSQMTDSDYIDSNDSQMTDSDYIDFNDSDD